MHFAKHPHLRPAQITPLDRKPGLIEHLNRNWLFVWYGIVCLGVLAAIVLVVSSMNWGTAKGETKFGDMVETEVSDVDQMLVQAVERLERIIQTLLLAPLEEEMEGGRWRRGTRIESDCLKRPP
jgi:hypothetical protein